MYQCQLKLLHTAPIVTARDSDYSRHSNRNRFWKPAVDAYRVWPITCILFHLCQLL